MLKIWTLYPKKGSRLNQSHDTVHGFVVIASSEDEARKHAAPCRDECPHSRDSNYGCVWSDPEFTSCEAIGVALEGQQPGCVMSEGMDG